MTLEDRMLQKLFPFWSLIYFKEQFWENATVAAFHPRARYTFLKLQLFFHLVYLSVLNG